MPRSARRRATCELPIDPVEAQPNRPFDLKADDHRSRDESGYDRTESVPFLSTAVVVNEDDDSLPKQAGLYLIAPLFASRNPRRGLPHF
jgi:hypothetical protein